ncbi:P2X purinoceptor 7-like [Lytechinus variegatus]|uniref:P2X purinoceptor 7-like n=1 Tax=Lytechinus variegatus TaxID=7654 RepID=UPI001BB1B4EC|nr:P2X purinoceptor 7-like [Lytechinus variegatus]
MMDFDISDISMADLSLADVDIEVEDPVCCTCTGSCFYGTGKRSCPCKSGGKNCTRVCRCGEKRPCRNRAPDVSTSESSDEEASSGATQPVTKSRRLETAEDQHKETLQKFVSGLDTDQRGDLLVSLLARFPEAFMDAMAATQPEPPLPFDDPSLPAPPYCRCGKCRPMPTDVENVCCGFDICVSTTQAFADAVLNGNVLAAAMRAANNEFPRDIARSNESYWHYAYKQFVLIHHGRLGAGIRRVVPSCSALRIRRSFPAPNNRYKGFVDGVQD